VTLSVPRPTAPEADDTADLRVVPARYPWRWVGIAVVLVLLAQFAHGLATNPGWDWPTFAAFFTSGAVVTAVGVTLELTAYGSVLGFAVGVVLALMRLSHSRFLRTVS
jgi:polar amino acid transport system permease protein